MGSWTTTLGDGLGDPGRAYIGGGAAGVDVVSDVVIAANLAYTSGGFDSLGNAYTSKPVMIINVTVRVGGTTTITIGGTPTTFTNNSDVVPQIGPNNNGTSSTNGTTTYTSITSTTTSVTTQAGFKYAAMTGSTHYYGFELISGTGSTIVFARDDGTAGTTWKDGTQSHESGISGQITQSSIPNEPTSLSTSLITANGLRLAWTAPTDNGGTDCSILGYRINYKLSTATRWSVLVANTGTTTTNATLANLTPETTYNFQVAAINQVTDLHNNRAGVPTVYNSITAHVGVRSATITATTDADHQLRVWDGTQFKKANVKVFDGTNFIEFANTTAKVWTGTAFVQVKLDES